MLILIREFARNAISKKIVEFVDIAPTVCDLAGVKPFVDGDGRSLRPLMLDPNDGDWRGEAWTQILRPAREGVNNGEMVMGAMYVNDESRYIEWDGGRAGVELYDRGNDSSEHHNLATHPDYQQRVSDLEERLGKIGRQIPVGDPVNQKRL